MAVIRNQVMSCALSWNLMTRQRNIPISEMGTQCEIFRKFAFYLLQ